MKIKRGISTKEALIKIECEDWRTRASRWARKNPFIYRERQIKLSHKTKFGVEDVETDGMGNIKSMPLLVGKPCFGVPTAFLRMGGDRPKWVYKRGLQPTRCMKCPVRSACVFVAKERIRATPEISTALKDWQEKGGREGLKHEKKNPLCMIAFEKVARLVSSNAFSSVNDDAVKEHYRKEREGFLKKDRDRKRREWSAPLRWSTG